MTKVKAFTLIELVLAMMLAAIVTGMCYTAFTLVTKMYGSYRLKNLEHADLLLARQVLNHDAEVARLIRLADGGITFLPAGIRYEFLQDGLLRQHLGHTDTLMLSQLYVQTMFQGKQVNDGVIDQVVFRFRFVGSGNVINVHKIYTSADLFDEETNVWIP